MAVNGFLGVRKLTWGQMGKILKFIFSRTVKELFLFFHEASLG